MSLEELKAIGPFIIALLALAVSLVFNLLGHLDKRNAAADRKQAAKLAREKELQVWARDIAAAYSELQNVSTRTSALTRLSVLVDYGRMFFPNDTNQQALALYERGLRSSVLDPLVETCVRCRKEDWSEIKLAHDWREFTDRLSEVTTAFAIGTAPETNGKQQYRNP